MDLSLSKEQSELIYLIKEVIAKEIKKFTLLNTDYGDSFDWRVMHILAKHNLLCPNIPKDYGGLGLDIFTTALVIEEIATLCPGAAAVMDASMHGAEPILLAGSKKQKEEFLPQLTGEKAGLAAFALTENTGGSDLSLMNTLANKKKDAYEINGSKDYVINAAVANFISLVAFTDPKQKKASMRLFILPQNTPGLLIGERKKTSGIEYAHISKIYLQNAKVASANIIKEKESGSGYLLLSQTFDLGRALVGATSVGIARAAYEVALEYAENRIQFGKSIKEHQAIAFSLADMATKIEMARLITWKACWLIDQGGDYTVASAMAKVASSRIAQEVSCAAADIFGAKGYEKGTFIEQLVRDARVLSTIEGSNNMQQMLIASLL